MKRTLIAAAALAVLAAPALASDPLARAVGAEPGAFTAGQLVALKAAQDDDNHVRVNQIRAEAGAGGFGGGFGGGFDSTPNLAQIAGPLDVEGYSAGRIVALKAARDEDDSARIAALQNVGETATNATVSSRGTLAPEQLSRSAGVAPGALSTADILRLKAAQAEDDHFEINRILAKAN
ncbi:MAG: hypothetical protein AAGG09_19555 [Pseudomonadota bacterium]